MSRPATPPNEGLPSTPAHDVGRVRDQFENAWKAGAKPQIEQYLPLVAESLRAALLRELILVEAHHRRLGGEDPRAEDYAERFTEISEEWLRATTVFHPCASLLKDRFEVLAPLGAGGMGAVFRARDLRLNREVAVKVINSDIVGDDNWRRRFIREAQAMAAINDDHVVKVFDCDEVRGTPYLVMELLQGESLAARLKRQRPLAPAEVEQLARDLACGLGAVHAGGLVHRDVKPSNIWLEQRQTGTTRPPRAKLLDFGLARTGSGQKTPENLQPITQSGAVLGTPGYMSPEQVIGGNMDGRSDLFSLGCVLYESATGVRAFTQSDRHTVVDAILRQTPAPPRSLNANISPGLSAIIMHLLAKNPLDRPQSARELLALLEEPPPPPARSSRAWLYAGAGSAAVLLLLVGYILVSGDSSNKTDQPASRPDTTGGQSTKGTSATSRATPSPELLGKDPDRAVAIWALQLGAYEVAIADKVATWRDIRSVDRLPSERFELCGIEFRDADITDTDLEALSKTRLPNLQNIGLKSNRRVTDRGLAHLSGLILASLGLEYCTGITDEGMKSVGQIKGLKYLYLDGISITDEGLKHLYPLARSLEELHISSIRGITPDGVRAIRKALKCKVVEN